jgi:pimeloyl-[acyl-carrier protein] synthase
MSVVLNPFSPEFQADPYPTYRALRESDPVYRLEVMGVRIHVLVRYHDIVATLRDPRVSSQAAPRQLMPPELFDGNMFYKDPPDHTRLRALFGRAFLPQVAESLRPALAARANALLDAVAGRGEMDVVSELAIPYSLGAIIDRMGLPASDAPLLKRLSDELAVLLDGTRILSGLAQAKLAAVEMVGYFRDALERRRRQPGDDFLSVLLAAREREDALSESELLATSIFTMVAGHETMTSFIGSAVLALELFPEERARLLRDPSLIPSAVEEILRFDTPVQINIKLAAEDLVIGGKPIAAGDPICAVIGSANRDPAVFPDPDRLDVGRSDNRHIAFSQGAHYCIGAAMARVEAQEVLRALLVRLPGLRADPASAVRQPGIVLRGLKHLPARWAV